MCVTHNISLDRRDVLAGFTGHCDELPNVNSSGEDLSWCIVSNVCVCSDLAHEFGHNIMVAESHGRGTSSPYGNKEEETRKEPRTRYTFQSHPY